MQGSVSMFTAAKLVCSTFERHLEDRAQLICSDKLLNHATIQRLVIFWYQIPGEQLGCCDAFVNLRPVWESEDALDAFLKKESRDDSSTSGRQGTRGWFPRVFNMRAMKHKCADFDHCRWNVSGVCSSCRRVELRKLPSAHLFGRLARSPCEFRRLQTGCDTKTKVKAPFVEGSGGGLPAV